MKMVYTFSYAYRNESDYYRKIIAGKIGKLMSEIICNPRPPHIPLPPDLRLGKRDINVQHVTFKAHEYKTYDPERQCEVTTIGLIVDSDLPLPQLEET